MLGFMKSDYNPIVGFDGQPWCTEHLLCARSWAGYTVVSPPFSFHTTVWATSPSGPGAVEFSQFLLQQKCVLLCGDLLGHLCWLADRWEALGRERASQAGCRGRLLQRGVEVGSEKGTVWMEEMEVQVRQKGVVHPKDGEWLPPPELPVPPSPQQLTPCSAPVIEEEAEG